MDYTNKIHWASDFFYHKKKQQVNFHLITIEIKQIRSKIINI